MRKVAVNFNWNHFPWLNPFNIPHFSSISSSPVLSSPTHPPSPPLSSSSSSVSSSSVSCHPSFNSQFSLFLPGYRSRASAALSSLARGLRPAGRRIPSQMMALKRPAEDVLGPATSKRTRFSIDTLLEVPEEKDLEPTESPPPASPVRYHF